MNLLWAVNFRLGFAGVVGAGLEVAALLFAFLGFTGAAGSPPSDVCM